MFSWSSKSAKKSISTKCDSNSLKISICMPIVCFVFSVLKVRFDNGFHRHSRWHAGAGVRHEVQMPISIKDETNRTTPLPELIFSCFINAALSQWADEDAFCPQRGDIPVRITYTHRVYSCRTWQQHLQDQCIVIVSLAILSCIIF